MARCQLYFEGVCWPAAKAFDQRSGLLWPQDAFASRIEEGTFWKISTTGAGRRWTARSPRGFWRTFCRDLDLKSGDQIVRFVRRYGDPGGELAPTVPIHTAGWGVLRSMLHRIERAWGPPGLGGISRVIDDKSKSWGSEEFVELVNRQIFGTAKLNVARGGEFVLRFDRLGDFMMASAMDMWARRALMRQCDNCGHWYELQRNTSRTCSTACRNALLKRKKERGGGVSSKM